jgi:NHLM bacteriocin system ABC transporter ATP-binding protein
MSSCDDDRLPACRSLPVEGNSPLTLADPDAVWLVQSGQVHLFAAQLRGAEPSAPRIYLLSAQAGEALLGIDLGRGDVSFTVLAIGVPGTRLTRLSLAELRARALDPATAASSQRLLEQWIDRLSAAISRQAPPRNSRSLPLHGETTLAHGEAAHAPIDLIWVEQLAGESLFAGNGWLRLRSGEGPLPLSRAAWLRADGASELATTDTANAIAQENAWRGLQRFHRIALDWMALHFEREEHATVRRLAARSEADRLAFQRGLASLSAAFQPRRSLGRLAGPDPAGPLLAACRLIGRAQSIGFRAPPAHDAAGSGGDLLRAIARLSRVRYRQVALSGRWWGRDNGALLGFLRESGRPVALLPRTTGGYELADPTTGTSAQITAEVASSLARRGYTFYRQFPDRKLGLIDLLRFDPGGIGFDRLRLILVGALGGIVGLAAPLATGILFDRVVPAADRGQLAQLALALLTSAFAAGAFQVTRALASLRLESKLSAALQAAVWDRLLGLPVPFFRAFSSGDLAVRAMGIDTIRQALAGIVSSSLLTAIFSIFSFGLLFWFDTRLGLVAALLLLVAIGLTVLASLQQLPYLRLLAHQRGRLAGLVLQLLSGIAKIRVAGAEQRAFAVWAQAFGQQAGLERRAGTVAIGLEMVRSALPIVGLLAIFAVVAWKRSAGLSTGAFLAFNAAFAQVMAAVLGLSAAVTDALEVIPVYERARPILETLPEDDVARVDPGELNGEVELSHVTFRYRPDGPVVLNDVSLRVAPGQFVALVGPSGSGKSTILRLLLGFDTPESGSVRYDAQDLAGLDPRAVRYQIGVVLQSGRLMSGDLYTNIVGSTGLTLSDAWQAARLAGLDEEIRRMPMGMHTVVSEGASTLSGGQRQRLLIARALVNRPRILLFDEATSALDNQAQATISRSLAGLRATRIVIAHRLSTVREADCIYVVQTGRIVQQGRYDALMQEGGPFAELARRQII